MNDNDVSTPADGLSEQLRSGVSNRWPHARRGIAILAMLVLTAGLGGTVYFHRLAETICNNIDTSVPVRPVANAPFITTPQDVVEKMVELVSVGEGDLLYDLGCGDGRIAVTAAKKHGCRAVGYDIDPVRVEESRQNAIDNGVEDLVTIEEGDVFTLDLSPASRVTMYLLPGMIAKLIPQLEQLQPGSRIVSHDFEMKGAIPDESIVMMSEDGHEHTLHLWTTPLKLE